MDLKLILEYIDPSDCNYQEWVNVGMALKHEGYTAADWDTWSARDGGRYHAGECFKKWSTFVGAGTPVTGGTIVQMAKDRGWTPALSSDPGYSLDWDSVIQQDDVVIVDKGWVEAREIKEPVSWDPVKELITYLETLFESDENVGYVTRSFERDGKFLPTKGCWDRTAGQLIDALLKCKGDIGAVLGDYNPEVGAWIRFNPLDGKGVKNDNVTDYRFALVESDSTDLEKQNAIIHELELPVACLVFSGKKSVHAIVRVDAANYDEYRKRVDYLYTVCKKNGLEIDQQNKNPSRLSRMPGVIRAGRKQFLMETNIGKSNWDEWREWIEAVNDDLPDPEPLESVWNNMPALSAPLIDGVLRQGHKMLLAGPSKAGKSFSLIELCIAIAEGASWFGWPCTQGRVLYVNLELDRASCLHRFKDVYQALGIPAQHLQNIDIWNLRGRSVPMDKLAPKLIRRAAKKDYIAIVIDPIYKVITGDENSADQMANFCNQFDKVCTELGVAVIYCHHHSKGSQGSKRSMDRASGSGVFARDPDALLDLIELDLPESLQKQQDDQMVCQVCKNYLQRAGQLYKMSQDDQCSASRMTQTCRETFDDREYQRLCDDILTARTAMQGRTAWRIEGTLREFPKFAPVNLWFDYPVHHVDNIGVLADVEPDGEVPAWKKAQEKRKPPGEKKAERKAAIETAYSACTIDGDVTVEALAEYMGTSEKTVRRKLKEHDSFVIENGVVKQRDKGQN
ncbi:AAA family ATPase [Holdemania sp. 1001302B_160321_E10]|uniref:AAA family ATPase n=1 Tax=Holdemania sp. 1001302B_160321_E10 TaxID=2787120 RepID=UPI00189A5A2E|nr:AAA family ATPase [Holdemania sp. 1001302B_160321_E10]